jgi:hypothetical protein
MDSKEKHKKLTWKSGLTIFAACWVATVAAVYLLRQVLIPKDEMACYNRVITLQKAVDKWNKSHPEKVINDEIDETALVKEGLMPGQDYDREKHYHFVGETAHGPRVKCNKHEDNPLVLRLTGDTLIAVLVFFVYCSSRRYVLFDKA